MISFRVITEKNKDKLIRSLSDGKDEDACVNLSEIIYGLAYEADVEFAIADYEGCALIRVFDMGKYIFLYPYEICEGADVFGAIKAIAEYAMREEIPLVFSDVPRERLSDFAIFRHMDIDAEDNFGESFLVKIKTECMLIDEIPTVNWGRVTLNAITEDDVPLYAMLSKSADVNRYWGYNYADDVSSPTDEYFYECAHRDFNFGVSMSLAVRCEGNFCGEALVYAFDGMGGAEFAIRLLPQWQGKGIGRCTVAALMELGRRIGLVRLYSKIMKENEKSIAMLDSVSKTKESDGEFVKHIIELM